MRRKGYGSMNELEMCETLGIMVDPDKNRVMINPLFKKEIQKVSRAFAEATSQKELFGTVNEDLWLEFIPWHSLN